MIAGTMQAFPVIFYDELPIGCFNDILLTGNFGLGQLVWSEIRSKHRLHLLNILRCGRAKANVNQTTNHSDLYWIKSKILHGKAWIHTAGIPKISIKIVSPVVIGTHEPAAVSFFSRYKFMAAVSAYIVISPDLTAFVSLQKKRPRSYF